MTGSPSLTSANEPSAAATPKKAPSRRPETGISTRSDEEIMWRGPENANGVANFLSTAEISGKKVSWRQSKSFQLPPHPNMGLEDTESPRFQEILRVTNGDRKRTSFTKSYSLDPGYKGVHAQLEDVKLMIREKFDKAKEEVNVELAVFAGELVNTLEQIKQSHPEWEKDFEDLLLVAHQSARMSAEEFWSKCEGIVLDLDRHRQGLPMGILKQAHTRLLFILTRCTRLAQCQ